MLTLFFVVTCTTLIAAHSGGELLKKYGSIPKGVTLEGKALSFGEITTVSFDYSRNVFTINQEFSYQNPVTQAEFIVLLNAVTKDDRIGVSMTKDSTFIVYGALSKRDKLSNDILATDMFLGGVVYGRERLIGRRELPDNYKPVRVGMQKVSTACAFSFEEYNFTKEEKEIKCSNLLFYITMIPLSEKRAKDGGHLPDMELLEDRESFGKTWGTECKVNVDHLNKHKAAYMKIPAVTRSIKIGEATAFARTLRDSKVDLRALKKELVTRRRVREPVKEPAKPRSEKVKPPVEKPAKEIPGISAPKVDEFKD